MPHESRLQASLMQQTGRLIKLSALRIVRDLLAPTVKDMAQSLLTHTHTHILPHTWSHFPFSLFSRGKVNHTLLKITNHRNQQDIRRRPPWGQQDAVARIITDRDCDARCGRLNLELLLTHSLKCFKQRPFNGNYCNTVAHFKCSISRPVSSTCCCCCWSTHLATLTHTNTHTVGCINFRRSLLLNPVYFAKGLSRQLFNSRHQQQQ